MYQAFYSFAALSDGKAGLSKTPSKQTKLVTAFFETHILGIMAHFSDVVDSALHPVSEKRRSLKGVREMISLAGSSVSVALPQVRFPDALPPVGTDDQPDTSMLAKCVPKRRPS